MASLEKYATLSHARFKTFKGKGRDKKNKNGFHCSTDEVSVELSNTEERIIVESYLSSAQLQVRQPSLLHETVHAIISVIHEEVYGSIQREVSKKKLDSLTSVAAVHF